jgi:hypothetical protein
MTKRSKLDVPMDTTLSLRTTKRAANTFRARAKSLELSMGAYLDKLTQQSAVKNDLAPEPAPAKGVEAHFVSLDEVQAPAEAIQTPAEEVDLSVCPENGDRHNVGGEHPGVPGLYRCQKCSYQLRNGTWEVNS